VGARDRLEKGKSSMNESKQASGSAFQTRHLLGCVLVACMALFCSGAAFADAIVGNFDIAPGGGIGPSQGQVRFSLNADGTIAGHLNVTNGGWIEIFSWSFGASNTVTPPASGTGGAGKVSVSDIGLIDGFGTQGAALFCKECGADLSLIIGNQQEFTSVLQAFDCKICEQLTSFGSSFQSLDGTASSVDFVLEDSNGNFWGADAQLAPTPEPGNLALLVVGLLGVAGLRRRQSRLNTPPNTLIS
jgi:hypothetical protein